jgi:hypothetical protein
MITVSDPEAHLEGVRRVALGSDGNKLRLLPIPK